MIYLIATSLLWGLSFGLFKTHLSGLDPAVTAALRLLLALPLFLPFLRLKGLERRQQALLLLTGGVQYGLMYILLNRSFSYLQAHEVALFTITTPIWLVLVEAVWKGFWPWRALGAAALAVAGALILHNPDQLDATAFAYGFWLMQAANLCFAIGQIAYRHLKQSLPEHRDHQVFGWLLAGGALVAGLASLPQWFSAQPLDAMVISQWAVLLYMGTVATGIGFFVWNVGATKVTLPILAVFNNLKIPLAIAVSVILFKETPDWSHFIPGTLLMAMALLAARFSSPTGSAPNNRA